MLTSKRLLAFTLIAMMAFTVLPTASTVDAATKKVKVIFNANGGKIGSKTTKTIKIKKGKKVGTLPGQQHRIFTQVVSHIQLQGVRDLSGSHLIELRLLLVHGLR